jgi:predicted RNA-binding protein with PIN domain
VDDAAPTVELVEESDVGVEPDWPEPIRSKVAGLVASALTALPVGQVPSMLRAVARFAPAKRAKLGAAALLATVIRDQAFRASVVEWCGRHRPEALNVDSADVTVAAAAAVLLDRPAARHYAELFARRGAEAMIRAERDATAARERRLVVERDRLREALDSAGSASDTVRAEAAEELDRLRKRLREQGVRLREAKDEATAAQLALITVRGKAETEIRAARVDAERERERALAERTKADRAVADAEVARQSAREARRADEVRLGLLVDTLDGAVTGLRRELALGGDGPRPADLVRGATPGQGVARVDDPAALDRLLALPSVHLVVDGYNVTKTGYNELSLSEQRERLNHRLAVLAARTTAEVTVVYDGAGVVAVPVAAPRGVRTLFSDPGVPADDVIRALVAAEPEGRPVVVVTSDRAVADSVRGRGAHPVPSVVLLARLARV